MRLLTADPRCTLCGFPRRQQTYNAAAVGTRMQYVLLCVRCDLTPDPPPAQTP